jgi:protein-disulfide isomerase
MAHKGATQQQNSGRRRGEATTGPARPRAQPALTTGIERALWITLAAGIAIALTQLYVHGKLVATHGAYTSFCNVNSAINCDAVLMSAYGTLLGLPVSVWGLVSYLLLGALLYRRGTSVGTERTQASLLLLGLALWNLCFAIYMAGLAIFAIHAFCLLCAGTYLVVSIIAVLAWRLASADVGASGQRLMTSSRMLTGGAAIAAGLAGIAAVQFVNRPINGVGLTPADVQARDPEFYEWYTKLPLTKEQLPEATHSKGPADAALTIVEFSDFECPACGMAFRDLHDFVAQHPDLVRLVFHHFPLDSDCNPHVPMRMHKSACLAAIAAECAARAGKFWEYHDLLFRAQDRLGRDDLVAKAVGLGIPQETFVACLADPAARTRVVSDTDAGARLGTKSTPTLVINGRVMEGAIDRNRYEYLIAIERRS